MYFVSLYKGKGYNYECSNSGVICLLFVVGKLCRRVLANRIRDSTDCAISDGVFEGVQTMIFIWDRSVRNT